MSVPARGDLGEERGSPGSSRRPRLRNLVVATDLTPTSENALRVGVCMGQGSKVEIHVLHVVDYPLDHHWSTGENDALTRSYHQRVQAAAEKTLNEQLSRVGCRNGAAGAHVHVIGRTEISDLEIVHFIHQHEIDLLVLGMSVREGPELFLFRDMAERLLPEAPLFLARRQTDC